MEDNSRIWTLVVLGFALIVIVSGFFFVKIGPIPATKIDSEIGTKEKIEENAFSRNSSISSAGFSPLEQVPLPSANTTENFAYLLSNNTAIAYQGGVTSKGYFAPVTKQEIKQAMVFVTAKTIEQLGTSSVKFSVINKPSPQEVIQYLSQVKDIVKAQAQEPLLKVKETRDFNIEKIKNARSLFSAQEKKILALRVPTQLVPLQNKLFHLTRNYRILFESIAAYANDPLRAILIIQDSKKSLTAQSTDLVSELTNLENKKITFNFSDQPLYEKNIFGLPEAKAQMVPVIDPGQISATISGFAKEAANWAISLKNWATEFSQKLLEWAQKLATEQLKNTLVQFFVNQTISWVNGGGEPQFITNWKAFAQEAVQRGTEKGLVEVSHDVCGTFGSSMINRLSDQFNSFFSPEICEKSSIGKGLENFANSGFSNDSWGAYGYAISPQGNYFQQYIENANRITQEAEEERSAAEKEAEANSGFKSTKICIDTPGTPPPDSQGRCPDGSEPANTTPGIAVRAALEKAIQAPVDRIVNADDLIDLAFTMANSVLSNLIGAKEKGLSGGLTLSGSPSDPSSLGLEDVCANYDPSTTQYDSCMLIAGSGSGSVDRILSDLDDQITTTREEVGVPDPVDRNEINQLKNKAANILDNRIQITFIALSIESEAQDVLWSNPSQNHLDQVQSYCGALSSRDAAARVREIQPARDSLNTVLLANRAANIDTSAIQRKYQEITSLLDLEELQTAVSQFENIWGTETQTNNIVSLSERRKTAIQNMRNEIQSTLDNMCRTAIRPIDRSLLVNP